MLIGVVSDTHNNLKNIDQIISLFNDKGIQTVIHTGHSECQVPRKIFKT